MKITKLEVIKVKPRWMFLKMHTDTDIYGLGEPVLEGHCNAVEAVIREFEEYLILEEEAMRNGLYLELAGVLHLLNHV